MDETKKKRTPVSTITILAIIIIFTAILTHIVPSGEYERTINAEGKTVVVPGSYHTVASSPVPLQSLASVIYNALIDASSLIAFIFVVGGAFGVINRTGAISSGLNKLISKLRGKEELFIFLIMTFFCVGGATYGMAEETIPFVSIMVAAAIQMGFDPVIGVSMVLIGVYCGYAGGALNPFNTGIAQSICELPTFSGIGLRVILTIGALLIAIQHIISYGKKYKKKTASSKIIPDFEDYASNEALTDEIRNMTSMDKLILLILATTIGILVFGILKFNWYFEEMAALFTAMAIVAGMLYYKGDFNATMKAFIDSAKDMASTVLVVAMARGVLLMMQGGGIMDTFIYALSIPLSHLNPIFTAWGMYLSEAFINFAIPSSSGQATVVMPIFSSLADLNGITRQTAILAYQSGDGFWNLITPTHATTMACIGIGGISYKKWVKFALPLILKISCWALLILAYAVTSKYGPF